MMNKILILILSGFVAACSNPPMAYAKPSAPVKIEYSVPKTIEIGADVTTVVRFVAKTDLQRLTLSAVPYSGLELITGGDNVEFTGVQKGEVSEMVVNIRLANKVGYLSVFATTTNLLGKTQSRSVAIRYGAVDDGVTVQKMQPQGLIDNSKGERLILMPGSAR